MWEFTAEIRNSTDFNASTNAAKSSASFLASFGDNTGVSNTNRSEEGGLENNAVHGIIIPLACYAPDTVCSLSSIMSTIKLSTVPYVT
jgi:hypothetical protein